MSIVSNPLPITAPREVGNVEQSESPALFRLRLAVAACVGFIRALLNGSLLEWHEDEALDATLTPIRHGLKRRPWGVITVRNDSANSVVSHYDAWTEDEIVITTSAASTVSFILF